jgi:dTDP-4-dehydrorhamnose 3,5-epimerase
MRFIPTRIGAYVIEAEPHVDARGGFARVFCRREFEAHGLVGGVAQVNLAVNPVEGTLRGLHYQLEPRSEAKLVRCVRGALFDVVVDARPDSPTYLDHIAVELGGDHRKAVYVPPGFAHGYQTLAPDTEVLYQASDYYSPTHERGLRFDDPAIGVRWPLSIARISDKDASWQLVSDAMAIQPR